MAAGSQRQSTRNVYASRLRHFTAWCLKQDLDPTEAPLTLIADFFMHLFKSGLQVATVSKYFSAFDAIHQGFLDSSTLSTNETIKHPFVACSSNTLR